MSKVLIVDDHSCIRFAARLLMEQSGYEVVGEADSGVEALRLVRETRPDLVILDIGIPRLDGLEVIGRLRGMDQPPHVLVLTGQMPAALAGRCFQAGAMGFVCKQTSLDELKDAAKAVLSGNSYFPSAVVQNLLGRGEVGGEGAAVQRLSDRELSVLQRLSSGESNKEIAAAMILSPKTISTYKARLLEKLNVKSLVQLVDIAKRQGIA